MCKSKKINRLNVSFIWTRTFFDFFKDYKNNREPGRRPPFDFFLEIGSYRKKFRELQADNIDAKGLTLPWVKGSGNSFWKYYFGSKKPNNVTFNDAWKNLAPFRQSIPVKMESAALHPEDNISAEIFFYKHGIALLITVRLMDSLTLEDAAAKAKYVRDEPIFRIAAKEETQECYHLNGLSKKLLDMSCTAALGRQSETDSSFAYDPFSISTVIDGGDYYRDKPVEQGDEIHSALERLTNRREMTANDKLAEKRIKNIQDNGANTIDCLYADRQGRTVWIPRLFTARDERGQGFRLGCYHRNLVLASLQVASIGAFFWHHSNKSSVEVDKFGFLLSNWKFLSSKVLSKLSDGKMGKTYRTESARLQIDQNKYRQ